MSEIPGLSKLKDSAALTEVDCGLCGSAERTLKFQDGPFSVVTCKDCELTYVTPRLNDASLIDEVYNEGYWSSSAAKDRGYTDYRADQELYLRTYRRRMKLVRRHFEQPGRVLDVGCAAGFFLKVMQEEGWQVTGLEPSDAIRPHAEELLGSEKVIAGLLGQVELEAGSFDLITLWDVIEHIPDTVSALREVRRLLAPGGRLLVETQNVNSRAAKLLGPKWQHYKHAEHIYHFNPKTIQRLFAEAGFEILENGPWLGGKYVSMGFLAERVGRLHPVLSTLASPLNLLKHKAIYVNLFDEMILMAKPS